jgi:predicted nuclease with TOPRIM domain
MEEMQEQIQRIENKVQQLLKEYNNAQKEIHRLQKENSHLAEQLQDAQSFPASNLEDKAKKDLEKRINTYLKDIDKCLALLHS